MIIVVDTSSGVPPYEQIRSQVAQMIGAGVLEGGARLPTIQQLANDLQLAPGTVSRAFKELERDGLLTSHRRRGSFVREGVRAVSIEEQDARLDQAVQQFVLQLRQIGVDPETAIERVRALFSTT